MADEIYITPDNNVEPPIVITVSGSDNIPIVVTTSNSPVLSVNGYVGVVNLNKSDIDLGNVENISISGVSGVLQNEIDNLDLNYASQFEFNDLSGKLISTGQLLINQINGLSGELNITGLNLQIQIDDLKLVSGDFVTRSESGQFYPASNPQNFITGIDLSSYVLKSETGVFALSVDLINSGILLSNQTYALSGSLNQSGADLMGQINNLNSTLNNTGIYLDDKINSLSGLLANYYPNSNPSGFINSAGTAEKANYLNGGGIVGDFSASDAYNLQQTVSNLNTVFYPLNSNPSGYATNNDLQSTGVNLQQQINDMKILAIAYAIAL